MTTEREKALESAISQMEKRFGEGALRKLGEAVAMSSVDTIPTG